MSTTFEEVDQAAQEIRRSMIATGDEVDSTANEGYRKVSLTSQGFFDKTDGSLLYPGMRGKKSSLELDKHYFEETRAKTAPQKARGRESTFNVPQGMDGASQRPLSPEFLFG